MPLSRGNAAGGGPSTGFAQVHSCPFHGGSGLGHRRSAAQPPATCTGTPKRPGCSRGWTGQPGSAHGRYRAFLASGTRPRSRRPARPWTTTVPGTGTQARTGPSGGRRWLIGGVVVAVLLVGLAGFGCYYFTTLRYLASTNDAYLQADDVTVSPSVGGYVAALEVTDNQSVAAGQVLVRIDERDYRAALAQRQAAVAQAQADIANQDAQIALQLAKIDQAAGAGSGGSGGAAVRARRAAALPEAGSTGNGTVQRAQQTSSNLAQQQAQLAERHGYGNGRPSAAGRAARAAPRGGGEPAGGPGAIGPGHAQSRLHRDHGTNRRCRRRPLGRARVSMFSPAHG